MAKIKAVFFDQDGVIIDTERDGHRVAFNQTFKDFGYDFEWDVAYYHELLQVAGGKERMKHHLRTKGFGVEVIPEDVDDLIIKMHKHKTAVFVSLIESGKLPLRPGVKRLTARSNLNSSWQATSFPKRNPTQRFITWPSKRAISNPKNAS